MKQKRHRGFGAYAGSVSLFGGHFPVNPQTRIKLVIDSAEEPLRSNVLRSIIRDLNACSIIVKDNRKIILLSYAELQSKSEPLILYSFLTAMC